MYSSNLITWTNPFFEKWGLLYTNREKSGQSYTFCWKKVGYIIYLAALKKGPSGTHIRAMPHIGSYQLAPPPPPTHTPPPPPPRDSLQILIYMRGGQKGTYPLLPSPLPSLPIPLPPFPARSMPHPLYPLPPPPPPPPPHTHLPCPSRHGHREPVVQDCWLVQKSVGVVILCKATCDWLKN